MKCVMLRVLQFYILYKKKKNLLTFFCTEKINPPDVTRTPFIAETLPPT